ncbi:acetyl-CoA carboxylase biotin carboxylase subunit [Roseibium salinum]|uniref:Acetyl/propionyl/methylcrotonyl-CoA carboxylase subunit alpha n=1 Tax=Roseibium salinum TaxID=1604349 RepID=A0ABT3R7Q0_9HYPH|nr:acetyl/propionyl/methylcrotonyl-CoA carboxylase subunit alpha [Roseibium sp. DSM 29163]MCX2725174.1 acetyl/propionyl/methylcrotonyl-CoA carboxylase subunit alpha [Roseibium sp. DSM 29163]MDN3720948.1 acetyl/propionyl/methylcrotonyl-CoA carboxylase subunit alpha [Roseibium salinum]
MFKKILIANRGEIACRVMATARKLGIKTVAVYSDADAGAKHVAMADEAYRIGPAPVSESYLKTDAIIDVCRKSGAEAVHPGYGFLSENPDFVDALDKAGITFIGPSSRSIGAMGLKDAAKALMVEAGVPVVPGYHGDNQDPDFLKSEAEQIGYPVLIKARAGGGGKGMRRVDDPKDFLDALKGAQREGEASFGDGRVLIEKYLTKPRHIEIQVFGDNHGNAVHLFERDCSLQRRHQKVIEEAPAPGMPEEMRRAMGEAAVKAAKAIDYSGAGTIEFIADVSDGLRSDRFYFMEMNTRLQVEHPVTEMITGEDLVEWQLRVASGEPLPKSQDELSFGGWAFEARLYAEDAPKGFLPAIGTLDHLVLPEDSARVDSGVRAGDEITPYYDPMIAKVIVHGPTRDAALGKLLASLEATEVAGCVTNAAFLAALCRHEGFARGDVDTGLIDRDLNSLIREPEVPEDAVALAALTALGLTRPAEGHDPFATLAGWRIWSASRQYALLEIAGERLDVEVHARGHRRFAVHLPGGIRQYTLIKVTDGAYTYECEGHRARAAVASSKKGLTVFLNGHAFPIILPDTLSADEEAASAGDQLVAPMPGLVKVLTARAGNKVTKDQPLVILEAMKMEHTLKAPRDGVIGEVLVSEGEQVTDGTVLLALGEEESDAVA